MQQEHELSCRQACAALKFNRSSLYYKPKRKDTDKEVIEVLNHLAQKHPRNGFKKMYLRIRNNGYTWNHKKVYRIYKKLGLNIRRRTKKRLPTRIQTPLGELQYPNQVWAMDFMSDTLWHGKRYRLLNIIDEFNRELLHVKVGTSLPARRVIEALEQVCEYKGYQSELIMDQSSFQLT